MATVVRQFTRKSGRTGLAQGKHRVNYGAAVRNNLDRLGRARQQYEEGVMGAGEFVELMQMQAETALGATATGINSLTEGLNVIVGLNDKQIGFMKLMGGSIQTTRAAIGIYRAWTSYMRTRRAQQAALAAGETAAYVAAQQYHRPVMAAAGVALFASAFGVGYAGGHHIASRGVDLNTGHGQREAMRGVA